MTDSHTCLQQVLQALDLDLRAHEGTDLTIARRATGGAGQLGVAHPGAGASRG
ncbi:L-aminoadipate-semialdehyde dehydrogenase [Alicycliphilus sp. B1]|nr:L-aminoadipate-semialdehyde dehydrogenase [Alicycliphilus sp. B1]